MPKVVLVIVLVLSVGVALVALVAYWLRAQLRGMRDEWVARGLRFRRGPESASYQGHERASLPLRGNGLITLTDLDLRFMQVMPRREFVVPLTQITSVEQHRAWKGHYSPGNPIMVVRYGGGDQADAIGLMVRDTQGWQDVLTSAAHLPPAQP